MNVVPLSSLLGARVIAADGRNLGRVHDVRVRRNAAGEYEVIGLVAGRRGVLARMGARRRNVDPIPWRDVAGLEPGRVTLR